MNTLEQLREAIDRADMKLLEALAERMQIVEEIGELKHTLHVDSFDPERFKKIIETRTAIGNALGLSPEYIEKLFGLIHDYALSIEETRHA